MPGDALSTKLVLQPTCKELKMAKRYSNTIALLLTASRPNTHVRPKIGRSVTKAFARDLD